MLDLFEVMRSLWFILVSSSFVFQHGLTTPVAHAVLEPVSDHDWPGMETRHGLMRRTPHHAVALQQSEHFLWGRADGKHPSIKTSHGFN